MSTAPVDVVVLLDSLRRPGGGESLAIENAIRLDPARFNRSICITRWEDEFEEIEPAKEILARFRDSGVRVIKQQRSGPRDVRAWVPLIKLLRREKISVLHGHLFGSNFWASIIGTIARVPAVVAHEHMWSYDDRKLRPLVDRFLIAKRTAAFIAVSKQGYRSMVEVEHIPEKDLAYIPNGIPSSPPGDGAKIRAELGIDPGAPVIGSVGHLRPEKAFEVLIEAAGRLRESHPDLRVVVAGEGLEREMLEGLRSRLGLDEAVRLIGAREDVPDVLAAMNVAVCCSDFEGGPLSVMEYMNAGLPVVATNVGGLPEMVMDGETGLLVPPRDPEALAGAIDRVLSDETLASRLGEAGRELRRTEYDIDVWAGRIMDLYDHLLAGGRGGPRP